MAARIFIAWLVGIVVYMFAMVISVYDGIMSVILQPLVGAVTSGVVVACAAPITAMLLRLSVVRRLSRTFLPAVIFVVLGFALVGISSSDGFAQSYADPATGESFKQLHFGLGSTGLICAILGPLLLPIGLRDETQIHAG